jgi:hypothetical protein
VESANVRVGSHIKQSFSLSVDSTDQCRTKLQSLIDTLNGTSCITGLHCCGDLSIHLMTLFPSLSSPLLILVPCCYHKVSSSSPLSDTMKRALGDCGLSQYLSIYGLRLAAQDSPIRWSNQTPSQHESHENHVIFRALAEVVLSNESLKPFVEHIMSGNSIRKLRFGSFEEFKEDFVGLVEGNVTGRLC